MTFASNPPHALRAAAPCKAAILFVAACQLSGEELCDPRDGIAPARRLDVLARRLDRCRVLRVAQGLDDQLRDLSDVVLAHPARGAGWCAEPQAAWTPRCLTFELLRMRAGGAPCGRRTGSAGPEAGPAFPPPP